MTDICVADGISIDERYL